MAYTKRRFSNEKKEADVEEEKYVHSVQKPML